jgi:hypothetical protein
LQILLSVMGKATEVSITFSERGVHLVTHQPLQIMTLHSNGTAKTATSFICTSHACLNVVQAFLCLCLCLQCDVLVSVAGSCSATWCLQMWTNQAT